MKTSTSITKIHITEVGQRQLTHGLIKSHLFYSFNKLGSRHAFVIAYHPFASHARTGVLGGRVSLREVRLCPTHPPLKLKKTDVKNCSNKTEIHKRIKTLRFVSTVCLQQQLKQVWELRGQYLKLPKRETQGREAHAWRKRGRWLPTCRLGFIRAHH